MPLKNWAPSHLYPHYDLYERNNSCASCLSRNSSLAVIKQNTGQHHCSTFEISPDHSHVSVFPVNCSAKYWSRVRCDDRHKAVHTSDTQGLGEYWIKNNTLIQTDYICPEEFNLVVDERCIRLKLFDKDWLDELPVYDFRTGNMSMKYYTRISNISMYDNYRMCTSVNNIEMNIDTHTIHFLHMMVDILEEYYPEGSDVYPQNLIFESIYPGTHDGNVLRFLEDENSTVIRYPNSQDDIYVYYWLPPPNFPTYMACFLAREKTLSQNVSDVSLFTCEDGSVIADVLVCNGRNECTNSEDEQQCPILCPWTNSTVLSCACDMFYYQCDGGGCVHYDHMCDVFADCPNGDDEIYCNDNNKFQYFNIDLITGSFITYLCDPPPGDMLMCRTKLQCYNSSAICHYDHSGGVMAHCEDGSHLGWATKCYFVECRQHFKCLMSYCIPARKVCDGIIDCPDGNDEAYCEGYICAGHMRCTGVTYCMPPHEICDGISHCPRQEDEKYCQVCPHGCHCKGTGLYCYNATAHLQNNKLYSPSVILLHNSYSMFLELYNIFFTHMNHVWMINLRNGSFVSLLENPSNIAEYFLPVKFLHLNHHGIYTLPRHFINGSNMIYVNLSDNIIQSVQSEAFYLLQNVQILSHYPTS